MVDYEPLKRFPGTRKEYDRLVRTICQECTVGCGLLAYVKDGCTVDVQGDEDHPISRGRLCAKGIAFVQGIKSPDRITCPSNRISLRDPFQEMQDWEKALDVLAERLRRTKDQHGPESLIIGCDPEAGLDFFVGALRFARLWGTPHVYHPLDEPEDTSLPPGLKSPASFCTDWIHSQCLFLIEADLATTHPVAFSWVLDAQRRGVKIIAVDTRFTTTLSKADMALMIRPEIGNDLGLALMKMMLEEKLYDPNAVKQGFVDSESWKASFEKMSLDDVEKNIGLSPEKLKEISRLLGDRSPVTLVTGKRLSYLSNYGIWLTMATAMGWIGIQGGGWYPLESGRPMLNSDADIQDQEVEAISSRLECYPYQTIKKREASSRDLPGKPPIKSMVCSGNCLNDFFSPFRVLSEGMDLVAYFGVFPNITWKLSHMVFPATVWAEKDGLCFSNDRAIQWGEKIVESCEGCRSGLDFWIGLAQRFGWETHFPWKKENGLADHCAFYNWLLNQGTDTAGCDLDRLRGSGDGYRLVCWPVQEGGLLKEMPPFFPTNSGKIEPIHAPDAIEAVFQELEDEHYPLYFQATRIISRSGDASHWWPWTEELEKENAVQINPETAQALGIENGDEILVSGAGETMEGRAWISRMVPRWMICSPRRLKENRVLIQKKDQTSQEALNILREFIK